MNLSLSGTVGPIAAPVNTSVAASALTSVATSVASMTAPPPAGKTEKAARDFESVLLTSLFDSLQKSFAFDAEDDAPGASDYRRMGTEALAEAISEGGGIGIARLIVSHLQAPSVTEGLG
jgi:Rod binding domain-containing protein